MQLKETDIFQIGATRPEKTEKKEAVNHQVTEGRIRRLRD